MNTETIASPLRKWRGARSGVALGEAAVDGNDGFVFGEDDIRAAGKSAGVKARGRGSCSRNGALCDLVFVHGAILWRTPKQTANVRSSALVTFSPLPENQRGFAKISG